MKKKEKEETETFVNSLINGTAYEGRSLDKNTFALSTYIDRKNEYLSNKAYKPTSIIRLMPEKDGKIDRRMAEPDFGLASELHKSIVVAKEAKALRMNRG
jgi:hypothetical protein